MKIYSTLVGLITVAALTVSCTGNAKPQVTVAHYTGTVVAAATELQKGVTAATRTGVLPVATAQKLTSYNEVIYEKSGQLVTALRAYDAATSLDVKQLKASEVQVVIAQLNTTIGQFLGTSLPPGVAAQINTLVGNVISAVGAVQAEIAKGL